MTFKAGDLVTLNDGGQVGRIESISSEGIATIYWGADRAQRYSTRNPTYELMAFTEKIVTDEEVALRSGYDKVE